MTVLESLAILEAAVLECKKRDIDTPEVRAALELLEPHVRPEWVIPQFRYHALEHNGDSYTEREGQQQVLRATFPSIRDCVRELLGVRAAALARKFHETHDMAVKDEIERLLKEYGKLGEPWSFRVILKSPKRNLLAAQRASRSLTPLLITTFCERPQ